MIKLIDRLFGKNTKEIISKEVDKNSIENVQEEPSHVNTPYSTQEVYYIFWRAIQNGFVQVEETDGQLFPAFFTGNYQGIYYQISSSTNDTYKSVWSNSVYNVLLKDDETQITLAIGGDRYWSFFPDDMDNQFKQKNKLDYNRFYVIQPETHASQFILNMLKELDEMNDKEEENRNLSEKTGINRKEMQKRQQQEYLQNKYKDRLNQA